jgi:hypothetical protein
MKRILLLFAVITFHSYVYSQDINLAYSTGTIADSLKKNAHTVVRLDEGILNVISPSKYTYKVHEVYTILNAEGASHLRHRLFYDKLRSVDNASVKIYNLLGLVTKKYSKKDYSVTAAYDGISLATDDKIMELNMMAPSYPCTIDIEYEQSVNGYIDLPDWYLTTQNTSTEIFRYTVTVPPGLDIRHRSVNLDLVPTVQSVNEKKIYTWEVKNIIAKKMQDNGYAAGYYYPRIEVAPNRFEYDNYAGSFSTWNEFAKWNYSLYQEKTPFSERRKTEIKALVNESSSIQEKINILYNYLQSNMRYVSVQFGIGGFKPFTVKYVDEKKYGDCKALSNYMRYLLDVVGIQSYPVLISAGYNAAPIDPVFPKTTFNHVILCVPNKIDSIWLECTSNDNEAGFLGSFTEERLGLLLTENGGSLVMTPASRYESNLLSSYSEIFLDEGGGAKTQTRFYATGDIAFEFGQIKNLDPADMKQALTSYMNYKSADVFETSEYRDSSRGRVFSINFEFQKLYAFKAGSKFFFPQKLNKNFFEALKDEKREYDYLFEYPYQKTDTTVFHLPKNFVADELPSQTELSNEVASYKKEVIAESSGKLKIITSLSLKKRIITPNQYEKLLDFFTEVRQYEDQNIVLKNL